MQGIMDRIITRAETAWQKSRGKKVYGLLLLMGAAYLFQRVTGIRIPDDAWAAAALALVAAFRCAVAAMADAP